MVSERLDPPDDEIEQDDDNFTEPDLGFDNPADDYIHQGFFDPNDRG